MVANGLKHVKFSNDTKTHDGVILPENDWVYYHIVCGFVGIRTVFGEKVKPLKSIQDIIALANFDIEILKNCLYKVYEIKDLLKALETEEYISEQLLDIKNYLEKDSFWDRECGRSICLSRLCCIDKKLSRRKKGVALVRNGYRGCNVALSSQSLPKVRKLISVLNKAIIEAKFELDVDWNYMKPQENPHMEIEDDYVLL